MSTKATRRRNGVNMVTVRVEAHFTADQLAALFWKGFYEWEIKQARSRVSSADVRKAVAQHLAEQGTSSSYEVENEDDWELKGGRDWALDQVMRVYGFTEADLDREDRERRARPKAGERVVNTCRGQYGFGSHGVVDAVRLDGELYVKYDDGTTQVVPAGWLAREIESEAGR